MEDIFTRKILPVLVGIFSLFFGDEPAVIKVVKALMLLQLFDFITGLAKCKTLKVKFDYRIFFNGLVKKLVMLVAVSFGYLVDSFDLLSVSSVNFEIGIAGGFCTVEILSILSNFKQCGLNIPVLEKYIKLD